MSDSKRRAFYRWYLLEKSNPGETRRDAVLHTRGGGITGLGLHMLAGCVLAVKDVFCLFVFFLLSAC